MKIGFVCCIHANWEALQAVEADMQKAGVEKVYCLGDVVGYGAEPRRCIERVRERGWPTLIGNHEVAVIEPGVVEEFNKLAGLAVGYTMGNLTKNEREWIRNLPKELILDDLHLVHASPADPTRCRKYVMTEQDAAEAFQAAQRPWIVCGHTHRPAAYVDTQPLTLHPVTQPLKLDKKVKAIFDVGSVGQPRDKDPRACWMLFDSATSEAALQRVAYDIEQAAAKMKEANLPERLYERLRKGV